MNYKAEMPNAKHIELDNYLITIMELSRERPEILYRVIELAKEKRSEIK